jgi:hypothetical protein
MSGGMLIHLTVRPLSFGGLLLAALVPWGLALLQSRVTSARPAECADWADRELGGRSAFATALELAGAVRSVSQPAQAHLDEWIARIAPHSLALLAARPVEMRWREAMITALVCTALAAGLLQLPTRPFANATTASSTLPGRIDDVAVASTAAAAVVAARAPAMVAPADRLQPTRDEDTSQRLPVAPAASNLAQAQYAATSTNRAGDSGGTATTTGGGREAGNSRDLGADGELTSAWSGALAKRMRELAADRGPGNTAADGTRAVEYTAADAATGASHDLTVIAAAATPPPATDGLRVGPVERAYLRAYWADNGARP